MHKVMAILLSVVLTSGLSACARPKKWTEEIPLHDGRSIEVERKVSFRVQFGKGAGDFAPYMEPTRYAFSTKNPDTGATVRWPGERDFSPVLLDFWERSPYLVLVGGYSSKTKKYGCLEIPYVFLRYDQATEEWQQVSATEFPASLQRMNLTSHYNEWMTRYSAEEVVQAARSLELPSAGYMTVVIPRSFASWPYLHKDEYRRRHDSNGCPHAESTQDPQVPADYAQLTDLEVLETAHPLDTERNPVTGQVQLPQRDENRYKQCKALLQPFKDDVERPELRGWSWRGSGDLFCNEQAFWLGDYRREPGHVVLTKYTTSGDLNYRVKFAQPDLGGGGPGRIVADTFIAEHGYIQFELWNWRDLGSGREPGGYMKARIREPM